MFEQCADPADLDTHHSFPVIVNHGQGTYILHGEPGGNGTVYIMPNEIPQKHLLEVLEAMK